MTINHKDLRMIRLIHGLSQSEMGRILGLHQPTIALIENGYRDLTEMTKERLADYFNLTPGRVMLLRGVYAEFNRDKEMAI
jgi:transcriptional regulator with XRE-family HTH domain